MNTKDTFFLVISRGRIEKFLKNEPDKKSISQQERVISLSVVWPHSIFEPQPGLACTVTIEDKHTNAESQVVIDPNNYIDHRRAGQTDHLARIAGRILESALNSNDDEMIELAISSLAECKELGMIVNVKLPAKEEEPDA